MANETTTSTLDDLTNASLVTPTIIYALSEKPGIAIAACREFDLTGLFASNVVKIPVETSWWGTPYDRGAGLDAVIDHLLHIVDVAGDVGMLVERLRPLVRRADRRARRPQPQRGPDRPMVGAVEVGRREDGRGFVEAARVDQRSTDHGLFGFGGVRGVVHARGSCCWLPFTLRSPASIARCAVTPSVVRIRFPELSVLQSLNQLLRTALRNVARQSMYFFAFPV